MKHKMLRICEKLGKKIVVTVSDDVKIQDVDVEKVSELVSELVRISE